MQIYFAMLELEFGMVDRGVQAVQGQSISNQIGGVATEITW